MRVRQYESCDYFKEGKQPSYLLAWIPESLLNEKGPDEWDKFLKMEEKTALDEDEGIVILLNNLYL